MGVHYFEGRITLSEEEILFRFLNAGTENYKMFRQWEKKWMLSATPNLVVTSEWKHLQRRVQIQSGIPDTPQPQLYSLRQMVAVVSIAVVVLLSGSYGLLSYFDTKNESNNFVLVTGYGEKSKILLTDGTVVWLNAGSTLRYANNFNLKNRQVELEGEAYFEVNKQSDGSPFLVKTNCYDVLVKGTKFNVTSYSDDHFSTTTLLEGVIDILYQGKQLSVWPGESLCFDKEKGNFCRYRVQATQYISWIEGGVEYDKITLGELAIRLSRKYDVVIHLDQALDENATFRVSLQNEETIGQFLQALSDIIPIRFERHDRDIYIKKQ